MVTSRQNFNPRAPCGARPAPSIDTLQAAMLFQSTRPMRGATGITAVDFRGIAKFQSTRPMRGATPAVWATITASRISIHAPHAGRDPHNIGAGRIKGVYFNPRAPCGARPVVDPIPHTFSPISIHAPHAGRDLLFPDFCIDCQYFNPRAPCGARLRVMRGL